GRPRPSTPLFTGDVEEVAAELEVVAAPAGALEVVRQQLVVHAAFTGSFADAIVPPGPLAGGSVAAVDLVEIVGVGERAGLVPEVAHHRVQHQRLAPDAGPVDLGRAVGGNTPLGRLVTATLPRDEVAGAFDVVAVIPHHETAELVVRAHLIGEFRREECALVGLGAQRAVGLEAAEDVDLVLLVARTEPEPQLVLDDLAADLTVDIFADGQIAAFAAFGLGFELAARA